MKTKTAGSLHGSIVRSSSRFKKTLTLLLVLMVCGVKAYAAASADYGEGAIAFYPMDDLPADSNAHGQHVYNAVDASAFPGLITASETDNAFAKFDSDAPGTLIYIPDENNRVVYRNPGSIRAGSSASDGTGAKLSIPSIGAEVSKYHGTGHTLEYFVKQDGTRSTGFSASVQLLAGYNRSNGQVNKPLRMYAPHPGGNSTIFVTSIDYYGDKVGDNPNRVDYTVPHAPGDGSWHHVALVARVNNTIDVYYDYEYMASLSTGGASEVSGEAQTLEFFRNNMQGRISCVRVSARQLAVGEFLHAVTRSEDWMDNLDLLAFMPCGGVAGTDVGNTVVSNVVVPSSFGGVVTLNSSVGNPFAKFASDQPGEIVYDGRCNKVFYRNPGSIVIGSDDKKGSGAMLAFKDLGSQISQCHGCGYTLEYFIKLSGAHINGYSAQVAINGGYENYVSVGAKALRMYVPLYENVGWPQAVTCIDYCGDKVGYNVCRMDYNASLHDGNWHHFAITETNNEVAVYFDYQYQGKFALKGSQIVQTGDVEFFRNNMQGALSCVRVTKGVLESNMFMRVLNGDSTWVEGGDAENKMLAFYGFRDAVAGTDATTTKLLNAVDSTYSGWAVLTTADSNPSVVISDDAPGAEIYGGEEYPEKPFYRNPRSIMFNSDVAGNTGRMYVGPDLAKTLTTCNTNEGYTIEYFFKMLDDEFAEFDPTLSICAGYMNGSVPWTLNAYLPYNKQQSTTYAFGFGNDPKGWKTTQMPACVWDGKWHHVAIVATPVVDASNVPAVTNLEIRLWLDYRCTMPAVVHSAAALQDPAAVTVNGIDLCRNKLHAKYSCVKVTGRALTKKEFMRTKPRHWGMRLIVR